MTGTWTAAFRPDDQIVHVRGRGDRTGART